MEDEFMLAGTVTPRVSVQTRVQHDYNIRLARMISSPDDFAEELQALAAVQEYDTVQMDIMSVGGSLDTCIMIRRAMSACQGNIIGWIGPTCASAATAIALQCDGWEVDEMSAFMVHTGSFGPGYGKARDVEASTRHTVQQIERFIRVVYTGFLTEAEILLVLDGKELYFVGEQLVAKLEAYAEYRDRPPEEEKPEPSEEVLDEVAEQD